MGCILNSVVSTRVPGPGISSVRKRALLDPSGGRALQACQHEMDMNTPTCVADYLKHEMEAHEEAMNELKGHRGGHLHRPRKPNEQADEEAERQLEENLWKFYRLVPPHSKFKRRWDSFIQALIMYNCTYIPMAIAFVSVSRPLHRILDYCVDGLFAMDMLVTMSTAFHNQHYELVFDRRQIISHYLSRCV